MKTIKAVGFDMDYTLAQYNKDFELLAYEGAKKKLVKTLGYPVSTPNNLHIMDDLCALLRPYAYPL